MDYGEIKAKFINLVLRSINNIKSAAKFIMDQPRKEKIIDYIDLIQNKTILQSNTSGPFIILKDNGRINNRRHVQIQFLNTKYECDVLLDNAIHHRVKDRSLTNISHDFDPNRITNYNEYIVSLLKMVYKHMMDRCYNDSINKFKNYGNIGISVCDRWKNDVNNFIYDCTNLPGYNKFYSRPYLYQLDKDYLQFNISKNNRIYSPETCMFLYYQDNANLKIIENSKTGIYGIEITPTGNFYARIKSNGTRYNIGTFCNIEAAKNAYNYWQLYFHNFELVPLLNDVKYMPPNEFIKYNINVKNICKMADS